MRARAGVWAAALVVAGCVGAGVGMGSAWAQDVVTPWATEPAPSPAPVATTPTDPGVPMQVVPVLVQPGDPRVVPPPAPSRRRGPQVGLGLGYRVPMLSPGGKKVGEALQAYGYDEGGLGFLFETQIDLVWRYSREIDVGARAGYAMNFWDPTSGDADAAELSLDVAEVGALVRMHPSRRVPFAFQFGAGVLLATTTLRGEHDSELVPFVRAELRVVMSTARVSPWVSFGYTLASWGDALGPGVDLPLGGLGIEAGFRFGENR
ncbi:MAG: hypothetical protein IT370_31645 [Deltaproteobacteria bacterium]|nr:hypothetical protein [Deltaproteobacteria bacterium]